MRSKSCLPTGWKPCREVGVNQISGETVCPPTALIMHLQAGIVSERRLLSVPRRPTMNRRDCMSCICALFYDACNKNMIKVDGMSLFAENGSGWLTSVLPWENKQSRALFLFATKAFFQPVLTGNFVRVLSPKDTFTVLFVFSPIYYNINTPYTEYIGLGTKACGTPWMSRLGFFFYTLKITILL